jgi:hypothetical protein
MDFTNAAAAVAAVDPNLFILEVPDYFLTAVDVQDGVEGEIVSHNDPAVLVENAIKYALSDLAIGYEGTYRLYDDDGNHMGSINVHTMGAYAAEYGVDIEKAMRDMLNLNF